MNYREHIPPFQWFGGKAPVVDLVWPRFGDVDRYVEPFFGSGAMLLHAEEDERRTETVNDLDGYVSNFWRAVQKEPDTVAHYADWPCTEVDLNSRNVWLTTRKAEFSERIWADPEYCDAKYAGWWVYGLCWWIGDGWCDPNSGPWVSDGMRLFKVEGSKGNSRKLPHLGSGGRGVARQLPHLGSDGQGRCELYTAWIRKQISDLSNRLRRVRVCSGDWSRVVKPSVTGILPSSSSICAVFLDPPYSAEANWCGGLYAEESGTLAHDVREWAIKHGDNKRYRIALCGYEGEHAMPESWECVAWKANGGMANISRNKTEEDTQAIINSGRERIWFSPHCLKPKPESSLLDLHEETSATA